MSERKPETYACIQAWDRIAEDHDHARKVTLETIEQLTKRIAELEAERDDYKDRIKELEDRLDDVQDEVDNLDEAFNHPASNETYRNIRRIVDRLQEALEQGDE